jgi:UTP--glucose-1-phosphate uridylyltransferase
MHSTAKIRKAVIPAAGYGTRLFPATKAVKKAMFPIVDRQGQAKPIILAIVEEALSAGIESVGIVVQPDDRHEFESFFKTMPQGEYLNKLAPRYTEAITALQTIGERITLLTQERQDGFGHAVFCAKEWVNDEPFLLLLGDHVYLSNTEASCAQQMVDVYQPGQNVIGVEPTPIEEIVHQGCVTGHWKKPSVLEITQICEKPTVDYARQHLQVANLPPDHLLSVFGLYILEPRIFDYLAAQIQQNQRERGEFQLTSCLETLRQERGMTGYLVNGRSFDTGQPDSYRQALIEFRQA